MDARVSHISDTLLPKLSELVAAEIGLHFPRKNWHNLERAIGSVAGQFGFKDAEPCMQWLVSSPLTREQIEILASHLTVGETYFLREKESLNALEKHILPELIRSRRGNEQRLRIWSAGCSTGEEPYSIAILLSRLIPDISNWHVTILATDINVHSLQKASEGVYTGWSFRNTPSWLKEGCFKRTKEGRFEILPRIKKMVSFSFLNLAEDSYPSLSNNTNAMDVLFCRNVLMYFTPAVRKKVIQRLHHSLVEGGWLIVSPSETSRVLFSQFSTANFPGATIYKRDSKKPQTVADYLPREARPYTMPSDTVVSFKPPLKVVSQQETDVVPPPSISPEETAKPKVTEPQRSHYMEALEFYEQGRYAEAAEKLIEQFSRRVSGGECSHTHVEELNLLIRACANQGKLAEALEWSDKAIAADKMSPGVHYLRASVLQEQRQIEEAVRSLKRALYLDPDFVLARFALGNLTNIQGRFKESDKHFESTLRLLRDYRQEQILPESEGITAGRLSEIITSLRKERH